jgi:signal recognition particle subunit SRP54
MFDKLTERLSATVRSLSGQARLTESNIQEGLREVRMALLEADVALPVVKDLIEHIRERAVGQDVLKSLTPGQALIKVVQDELISIMGEANEALSLQTTPPAVVLVAGLQGAGKTTSIAKLARHLQSQHKKSVMTVSCDVYRPAAIEQLKTLSAEVGAEFFPSHVGQKPVDIAKQAIKQAKISASDVLLVDTAGRLHIDDEMMAEIQKLHQATQPVETLFVVDSMIGQDAVNTARAFNEALPLTGVILTKADGDARGGAALSVRHVTGKPIKFIGVGEKVDALEPFHPDRIASRILGKGDVVSLVEEVQQKIDHEKAAKLATKIKKGRSFDLTDLRDQLEQMLGMGGLGSLMDKLPGMGKVPEAAKSQMDDRALRHMVAIINSMTPKERAIPTLINGSRRKRIANGSGTSVQQVNQLMKQYKQMSKMMKKMGKGGMGKMLRGMGGMMPGAGRPF